MLAAGELVGRMVGPGDCSARVATAVGFGSGVVGGLQASNPVAAAMLTMPSGTAGGAINIVTKQAGDRNFTNAETTFGTDMTKRVTLDVNQVISPTFSVRTGGLFQDANVAGRKSEDSIFDANIATFEDDRGAYNQKDAEGFIRLNALRMRIQAGKGRKLK